MFKLFSTALIAVGVAFVCVSMQDGMVMHIQGFSYGVAFMLLSIPLKMIEV